MQTRLDFVRHEQMQTRLDVAEAIGISDKRLCYLLYASKLREKYTEFEIPKRSGGLRKISAPPQPLLWLQRRLYKHFAQSFAPKPCVHGFVTDRSILTNASLHAGKKNVINFDLKDFFPTVHFGRVKGIFLGQPFLHGEEAATVIAQICCLDEYAIPHPGALPQGGAMSPFISNLACRSLDNDLMLFSRKLKLRYSRYADDLTFSTARSNVPPELIESAGGKFVAGAVISQLIQKHGFEINNLKIRVRGKRTRQEVTGIVVNEFPNVTRKFVRDIEGALHAWNTYGYQAAQDTYVTKYASNGFELDNVVKGKIAYLKMVRGGNDSIYRRLARCYNSVSKSRITVANLKDAHPCKLRNRTRSWNDLIDCLRPYIAFLQFTTPTNDVACGTCFHIGNGVFATAKHNLIDDQGRFSENLQIKVGDQFHAVEILYPDKIGQRSPDVWLLQAPFPKLEGRLLTQLRVPELGEEVMSLGYPRIPGRHPAFVAHVGTVEALPVNYQNGERSVQVSFQSGGGLSGGCLIDRAGFVLGIMVENVFMKPGGDVPERAYGQAVPIEYLDEILQETIMVQSESFEMQTS